MISVTWCESVLLCIFIFGLGGSLLGVAGLLLNWTLPAIAGYIKHIPVLLGLAGLGIVVSLLGDYPNFWLPPVCLVGLCGLFRLVGYLHRMHAFLVLRRILALPCVPWVVLLLASPVMAMWMAYQADRLVSLPDIEGEHYLVLGMEDLQEVPTDAALTDAGYRIPLYMRNTKSSSVSDCHSAEAIQLDRPELRQRSIRTAPPDPTYDCHGWVFATGRYWIKSRDVPQILTDNGYHVTNEPRESDLAIYYDQQGQVVHSGIVRLVASDSRILIESKWGWAGRFIHDVEGQPYGKNCVFFRSRRSGHRLSGLSGDIARRLAQNKPDSVRSEAETI